MYDCHVYEERGVFNNTGIFTDHENFATQPQAFRSNVVSFVRRVFYTFNSCMMPFSLPIEWTETLVLCPLQLCFR